MEGDRGLHNDAGLTQWHYFCVVNIHGTLYVADAYSGMVRADIQAYIDWLKTRTYKFTTKRVEALTMEEWEAAQSVASLERPPRPCRYERWSRRVAASGVGAAIAARRSATARPASSGRGG